MTQCKAAPEMAPVQPRLHGAPSPGHRTGWGLTLLRVCIGVTFLAHGLQKFGAWGWTGGAAMFAEIGIPLPRLSAVVVTLVEGAGGIALLIGLFTRFWAAVLAVVMTVALVMVHLPHGFFLPNGVEFVLLLGAGCLALVLDGGGPASVDEWRHRLGTVVGTKRSGRFQW